MVQNRATFDAQVVAFPLCLPDECTASLADCVDVQSETHITHTEDICGIFLQHTDHMEGKCMNFNANKHKLDECNHSHGSERVNSRFSLHVCAHVWRVLAGNLSSFMKHVQKETHNVLNWLLGARWHRPQFLWSLFSLLKSRLGQKYFNLGKPCDQIIQESGFYMKLSGNYFQINEKICVVQWQSSVAKWEKTNTI